MSKPNRFRIFGTPGELKDLPEEVIIEERYPAFVVAEASQSVIALVRKSHPVEEFSAPMSPPIVPAAVGMANAVSERQDAEAGPFLRVVRFRAPVRQQWLDQIETSGCQRYGAIGNRTLIVHCPNKARLGKLESLEMVERVTSYTPSIRVTPGFLAASGISASDDDQTGKTGKGKKKQPVAKSALADAGDVVPGLLAASFFTQKDRRRAKTQLRQAGAGRIVESGDADLIINLRASKNPGEIVAAIAGAYGLRSLDEWSINRTSNDVARKLIGGTALLTPPKGAGVTGKGEIVAVADSGLDTGDKNTIHPDFRGRVRYLRSMPFPPALKQLLVDPTSDDGPDDRFSGHGTHVAGSVLGNGARAKELGLPEVMGMAPQAGLVFQAVEKQAEWKDSLPDLPPLGLYGIPDDLTGLFKEAYDQGARIHSNSWGKRSPQQAGVYDDQARQVDEFAWQHKDFLILFSAGNEGIDVSATDRGIDARSITPPGTAKNCLTVGACENDRPKQFTDDTYGSWWPDDFPRAPFKDNRMADSPNDVVAFSGRGPCIVDPQNPTVGRRKPDVVAPGTFVLSTRSSRIASNNFAWGAFPPAKEDYMYMGGTSMATPLVAGCAALVRQYLRRTVGIAKPSAAMMKAVLIHSAQYLPYSHPRPDSSRWADNEQGWGRVNLATVLTPSDPYKVLFFDVTPGLLPHTQREFKISITDAKVPLRITLAYTDRPGRSLINNLNLFAFNPSNAVFIGNDFANTGQPDSNNNVEGIIVQRPASGVWRIRVVASNLPLLGRQDFGLVVSGAGAKLIS